MLKPSWPIIRRLTTPPTTHRRLLRALSTQLLYEDVDDRNDGALAAPSARSMQHGSMVHAHVAGTDGMARHEQQSHQHAATAMRYARLPYAECTATAFVSLSAQLHAFFDLSELTRAGGWDARERTSMLGPGARV